MYLEIDEGYFEHPKTLDLCARLNDSKACVYPLRLWKWACRSAKSGKLGKISAFAIEKAMDYEPKDGRCFDAMCLSGFIDTMPDGTFEIHDWMDYTGAAIKKMDDQAATKKLYRAHRDGKCDRRSCEWCNDVLGQSKDSPRTVTMTSDTDQTRPDQTSQDQTRPDPEGNPPRARSNPPANEPGKPSPSNVVQMFLNTRARVIGGSVGVEKPFSQAQQGEIEKAERWLSTMSPEDAKDIEPAIRLACEHVRDGVEGWTHGSITKTGFLFGAIVTNWRDLREELHGCAPKVAKPRTVNRPQEEPKTWKIVER